MEEKRELMHMKELERNKTGYISLLEIVRKIHSPNKTGDNGGKENTQVSVGIDFPKEVNFFP